ncbi:MAG: phosphotriesterase [Anaerolineae bacterium]
MQHLITTLGPRNADAFGLILPHEHVFTDLRKPTELGYAEAEAADVIALMVPEIERARQVGVTGLVECTPIGVGRRVDMVKAVSEATQFPIIVPTGVYREPWVPQWVHDASEEQLRDWMLGELTGEIEGTGVQAAWIKLSAGDDGITEVEAKILRAAATAARQTNALIGSHTIRGRVVKDQIRIIEAMGYTAERYLWIHTQVEQDDALHLEIARYGAWIEFDSIGSPDSDEAHLERILRVLEAGLGDHLLLSHDRGFYNPAEPRGGTPAPYTYLSDTFLPKLRAAGIDDATIRKLTHDNPFRAFSRPAV